MKYDHRRHRLRRLMQEKAAIESKSPVRLANALQPLIVAGERSTCWASSQPAGDRAFGSAIIVISRQRKSRHHFRIRKKWENRALSSDR
jgi:hypothetical protein